MGSPMMVVVTLGQQLLFKEKSECTYRPSIFLLFLTFSALVANPKKTTLHGGQSRSWSAEQGKKKKGLADPLHAARSEKIKIKITRRTHMSRRYAGRRYAGLGPSRVRTRIPKTRRLGQWVSLRKILRFRVR